MVGVGLPINELPRNLSAVLISSAVASSKNLVNLVKVVYSIHEHIRRKKFKKLLSFLHFPMANRSAKERTVHNYSFEI